MKILYTLLVIAIIASSNFAQPTNGLVAYYPFNGNADDESGNGNDGTIIGNPQFVNDRFGNSYSALSFDGIDDAVEVSNSPSFPNEDISFCYWINRNGNSEFDGEVYIHKFFSFKSFIEDTSKKFHSGFSIDIFGYEATIMFDSGNFRIVNINEWIFHAFTYDYSNDIHTLNVYVNDSLVNSTNGSFTGSFLTTSTHKMYLGRDHYNSDFIAGYFDDIRIYDRALSEQEIYTIYNAITSVNEITHHLPSRFSLNQNYPNPFNPSTTINYQIPKSSFVTVKVIDVLGKEIANLVNEERTVGNYEVEFSTNSRGSDLTSGMYFYRIQAGSFIETKKMVLMK